jgi:hypothetical protein
MRARRPTGTSCSVPRSRLYPTGYDHAGRQISYRSAGSGGRVEAQTARATPSWRCSEPSCRPTTRRAGLASTSASLAAQRARHRDGQPGSPGEPRRHV